MVQKILRFCSLIIFNALLFAQVTAKSPAVVTPMGKIEGYWSISENNLRYAAFEGIPYALPPIENRRFEEPQPLLSWNGTWQAKSLYRCLQYFHSSIPLEDLIRGDEDCLYLNVYTPQLNPSNLLDVIVFIHGGAFMFNSAGTYGPKFLMDKNVVFVSMNYRLGPLGFLCTEDSIIPGNNGLKDQLLALKWIKSNIQNFGGNPNSITLTGSSAGGASVHLHYLSSLSTGLFQRGIAQSGTALNPWVLMENPLMKTRRLAEKVDCDYASTKDLVRCLKQRSGRQIVDATKYFLHWLYNPFSPFAVVVDEWSDRPFLTDHPYILLKEGKVQNIPIIFSNVQSEGTYPAAEFIRNLKYLEEIEENWHDVIPHILDFNNTVDYSDKLEVIKKIKYFYFGSTKVSKATFPKLLKLITDRLFLADIEKAAKLHSVATNAPVRYYYFSYRGAHSNSESRSGSNKNYGASHGDDTLYVLSSIVAVRTTEIDIKMSDLLLNMWTTYANNSEPQLGNLNWKAMSKEKSSPVVYALVESPEDIEIRTASYFGNRPFWDALPLNENQNFDTNAL